MTKYVFDPAWAREKERLEGQAAIYEDGTRERIERIGVADGWRCVDVGAGTGTVASWLCEKVGPSGYVVATDLDTRFLDAHDLPNLEVRHHDIVQEQLEPDTYDLIHTRLVLMHLGENRPRALEHMIKALKPGGWLIAEEHDASVGAMCQPPDEPLASALASLPKLMQRLGSDPYYGRKLASDLETAGLMGVQADIRSTNTASGSRDAKSLALILQYLRDHLIDTGLSSGEEVDQAIVDASATGRGRWFPPLMVAAWGRRPNEE